MRTFIYDVDIYRKGWIIALFRLSQYNSSKFAQQRRQQRQRRPIHLTRSFIYKAPKIDWPMSFGIASAPGVYSAPEEKSEITNLKARHAHIYTREKEKERGWARFYSARSIHYSARIPKTESNSLILPCIQRRDLRFIGSEALILSARRGPISPEETRQRTALCMCVSFFIKTS